ncbi:MAG: HAD hydrolase family protein [Candidatus Omnitrophica bacterium]|nr:HAD hydrolase family protein [Candidatus Omnitrophota bacterium]
MKVDKTRLKKLFKGVKLLILDVDGVLTKGEIIYDESGRETKIFNVKDGLGVYFLGRLGIPTIFISARNSHILEKRAKDMGVVQVFGGVLPKEKLLADVCLKYKVSESEICFVGDDLIDLGMVERVGLGVAVSDAVSLLRAKADYVTKLPGGSGAVREVIDLIIKTKNLEKKLIEIIKKPS